MLEEDASVADILEDILSHKSSSISIKSIVSGDIENFGIRGNSASRADLLLFIQGLEDDPRLRKVESPISNLLAEKDSEFLIKLQVGHE